MQKVEISLSREDRKILRDLIEAIDGLGSAIGAIGTPLTGLDEISDSVIEVAKAISEAKG